MRKGKKVLNRPRVIALGKLDFFLVISKIRRFSVFWRAITARFDHKSNKKLAVTDSSYIMPIGKICRKFIWRGVKGRGWVKRWQFFRFVWGIYQMCVFQRAITTHCDHKSNQTLAVIDSSYIIHIVKIGRTFIWREVKGRGWVKRWQFSRFVLGIYPICVFQRAITTHFDHKSNKTLAVIDSSYIIPIVKTGRTFIWREVKGWGWVKRWQFFSFVVGIYQICVFRRAITTHFDL